LRVLTSTKLEILTIILYS
jgi:hypothetical protein